MIAGSKHPVDVVHKKVGIFEIGQRTEIGDDADFQHQPSSGMIVHGAEHLA